MMVLSDQLRSCKKLELALLAPMEFSDAELASSSSPLLGAAKLQLGPEKSNYAKG